MTVDTKALQVRFADKIRACIVLAEAHYKRKFSMPKINYNNAGTTAGTADYRNWQINISWPLFIRNIDETIDNTGPHELAHLIDHEINPENHAFKGFNVTRTGRVRRIKRDVHGDDWKQVCRVLGMSWDEITRCHDMDTSETKRITSRSRILDYKCERCSHVLQLSQKHAAELLVNPHARWHKSCKGFRLLPVASAPAPAAPRVITPPSPYTIPKTFVPPTTKVTPVPAFSVSRNANGHTELVLPVGSSKMDVCTRIFVQHRNISRGDMIAKFVAAGCTPAGASTYYQSIKKKVRG